MGHPPESAQAESRPNPGDPRLELLSRLARPEGGRIVLLVLDGVGDIRTEEQPATALEAADIPNLDRLAAAGALGRIVPVATGVTPGSGPGHLALFGYDPARPEYDIGRGVLEALGLGLELAPGQVTVRGNFATADGSGALVDRRAGRLSSEENRRLCARLAERLGESEPGVSIHSGEGHRFVLVLEGEGLDPRLADTDPQQTGVPPLPVRAVNPTAEATARRVGRVVELIEEVLADEPQANRVLLRGFSVLPHLPALGELYRLRCGAFAGYPLYRGVAAACGMEVVPCGKSFAETVDAVERHGDRFDYLFVHVKPTDMAGEDGDLAAKVKALEEVDRELPRLLALRSQVVAVTGDHSTPAPMRSHSWHPVPLLLSSPTCSVDASTEFTERASCAGSLGTFPARELMGLLLANAGRLAKYGA